MSALSAPAFAAEVAVVAVGSEPTDDARVIVERALRAHGGSRPIDRAEMVRRRARTLRPPVSVEPREADLLEREAAELLEAVAFGRDEETLARSRATLRRESRRLAASNRSERAATALGSICLFAVRALLHQGHAGAAREQGRECLRLVFDLDSSSEMHPPEVRTLIASTRTQDLGKLEVSAVSGAPDCDVRVQGRPAGKPPLELELVPGTYTVETDCAGAAAWLRQVTVHGARPQRVVVAPRLERALQADAATLVAAPGDAPAAADLGLLAEMLSVAELWTIAPRGAALAVTRFRLVGGELVASGEAREPIAPRSSFAQRLEAAVLRVLCGAEGCGARDRRSVRRSSAAWSVAGGVGAAAMVASWAAWLEYEGADSDLERLPFGDPRYRDTHEARQRYARVALIATGAGSAVFTLSAPFWLPENRAVPWWAWSVGAVGAGAVGVGSVLWFGHNREEDLECLAGQPCNTSLRSTVPLAPMLVTQGASLLSIPLTYAVRGFAGTGGVVGIGFLPGGAAASFRGPVTF